jgi:uncharacterized protein YjiS (DUF1127 family)
MSFSDGMAGAYRRRLSSASGIASAPSEAIGRDAGRPGGHGARLTKESPVARYRDVAPLKRLPNLRPRLALWLAWAELCLARAAERRHLSGLSDHELKDIGLSRADVEREGRRWPWDGPAQRG